MSVVQAWPHLKLRCEVEGCQRGLTLALIDQVRGDPLFTHFFIDHRRLAMYSHLDAALWEDLE